MTPGIQMPLVTDTPQLVEVIFLGTGTSGCLPNVTCLSIGPTPGCRACKLAMTPAGRKNRRRNTSIIARWLCPDGSLYNLLVDCGKSFYASALEWLPHYGINKIDAVFLTHGHADAILGLDDYVHFLTTFPYLVDRSKATGDVALLDFRTFDENKPLALRHDIQVMPLPVYHGLDTDGNIFYNIGLLMDKREFYPETTRVHLSNLEVIVLDALKRNEPFTSHFGYQQAIDECIKSDTDIYIRPAYDGMHLLRRPVSNSSVDSNEVEFDWIEGSDMPSMM
ncbi:beta-lactamase-like protein [Syncephalis plumigaleata]|nr:beta-lactamase-like protein [Syncephalis plumigaleata]